MPLTERAFINDDTQRVSTACVKSARRPKPTPALLWYEPTELVVLALVRAVAAKDAATSTHLERVADYALLVGRALGFQESALTVLRYGALLHDVGKIGVDDQIVRKPGQLSIAEYHQIMQHPLIGEQIVQPLPLAADVAPIIRHHHERWDGQGYPDGLAGETIPLNARIVAVADAFDAMTSARPYARPLTIADAMVCLVAGAGTRWDPSIATILIECLSGAGEQERVVGEDATPKCYQRAA